MSERAITSISGDIGSILLVVLACSCTALTNWVIDVAELTSFKRQDMNSTFLLRRLSI